MKLVLLKIGFISLVAITLSACTSVNDKWNVHNSWCEQKEVSVTNETIVLSVDTLFEYNRSSFNAILPKGQKQLDDMVESLKNNYQKINKIVLVGHTDRIGSEQYNERLGLERANTIKEYLIIQGINTSYLVESKGKLEPVTTNCTNNMVNEVLKVCLQPDRRVEIYIEGVIPPSD